MNDYQADERSVAIAVELMKLGVSHAGVVDLLIHFPPEVIERQLMFLPYRKAKRKEALIIDAIKHNYSPPKEFYYAKTEVTASSPLSKLDEGAQPDLRQTPTDPQGHGAAGPSHPSSPELRLEPGGIGVSLALPDLDLQDGKAE